MQNTFYFQQVPILFYLLREVKYRINSRSLWNIYSRINTFLYHVYYYFWLKNNWIDSLEFSFLICYHRRRGLRPRNYQCKLDKGSRRYTKKGIYYQLSLWAHYSFKWWSEEFLIKRRNKIKKIIPKRNLQNYLTNHIII